MRLPAFVFAGLFAACAPASAASLADVVRNALATYPAILIAQSSRNVAQFDTERARALHYPTVDLLGTRRLAGAARNLAQPRLRVNVWASGAIEATIEREGLREDALASRELETREDVAFEAAYSYLRLLRGARTLEATQRNLERHEALVKDFAAIATIDVGRRYDLVQARTRLEQVRLQIAEREAEIASARESLARFYPTRIPLGELSLPPVLPEPAPGVAPIALDSHPTVQAAQREVQVAEADTRVTRAERMPRVDVESTVGKENATQLVVSWPAFDLGRNAAEQASQAALVGARAKLAEQERLIEERQRSALQDYRAAERREAVSHGQIGLAEELVDVYREQFRIGRRNLLDLLNAFAELSTAEVTFEASRVDKSLARYRMEYALGRLAARFDRNSP
ncbi:MAG: TolC family protein [Burkholderiaceae bacterium]|jgi:adhesin transport system outer membrane protein|nr:TolC family protein [Burkholderiaceae bacterium]